MHARSRLLAVDEHLERAVRARRRLTGAPVAPLRGECASLPEPREPAAVVRGDRARHRHADAPVDVAQEAARAAGETGKPSDRDRGHVPDRILSAARSRAA